LSSVPDEAARKQLWRQAIPKEIILDHSLRWIQLARKLPLTGGEISAVAATALSLVQQSGKNTLTLDGLEQALALSHPRLQGRLRKSNRRKPGNSKS
jgi:hypothetical protein